MKLEGFGDFLKPLGDSKSPKKKLRRKVTQDDGVVIPEVETLLSKMKGLQDEGLRNRQLFFEYEARVLELLKKHGLDTYDRGPLRGTGTYGSDAVYDWEGIRKLLGPKKWGQILAEPPPDKDKLKAMVELGQVPADALAEFITDKPKKPYVTITRRNA